MAAMMLVNRLGGGLFKAYVPEFFFILGRFVLLHPEVN
jgi:hypothetical protein